MSIYMVISIINLGLICVVFIILNRLGVSKKISLLLAFVFLGISLGFFSTMGGDFALNPSVILGDSIYQYAIKNYGDPNSASANYSIPWILRMPQIHLYTTVVIYSLIGTVAQIIYSLINNTLKKFPKLIETSSRKTVYATTFSIIGIIALLGLTSFSLYITNRPPTETQVFNVHNALDGPVPDWQPITTFEVRYLRSQPVVQAGYSVRFSADVTNTGDSKGVIKLDISIDGVFKKSCSLGLLAGESKTIQFAVITYRQGDHTASIGEQTATYRVIVD